MNDPLGMHPLSLPSQDAHAIVSYYYRGRHKTPLFHRYDTQGCVHTVY